MLKTIPVCFVEDNSGKYSNFLQTIQVANLKLAAAEKPFSFVPALGESVTEITDWKKFSFEDQLWQLLRNTDAIFLIDMELTGSEIHETDFIARLSPEEKAKYDTIVDVGQDIPPNFKIGCAIIAVCQVRGITHLLASTQADRGYVDAIRERGGIDALQTSMPSKTPFPREAAQITSMADQIISLYEKDCVSELVRKTKDWFCTNLYDAKNNILPHNYTDPGFDFKMEREKVHMGIVQSKFKFFPDRWWADKDRAEAVHNCLKVFCGAHVIWKGGSNRFGLAGAYFLLLCVLDARIPDFSEKTFPQLFVDDLLAFIDKKQMMPINFLPEQTKDDAELSLRALCDFFERIAVMDRGDSNQKGNCSFLRVNAPFDGEDRAFEVELKWDGNMVRNFGIQVSKILTGSINKNLPLSLVGGKATSAYLRFVLLNQNNSEGIGNLNGIIIENRSGKRILRVGRSK